MAIKKRLDEVFEISSDRVTYNKALANALEVYPGFPKEGVNFVDIFPLFRSKYLLARLAPALRRAIEATGSLSSITAVAAPDARGFLIGTLLAADLGVPFIPFRKPGKLPCETISQEYVLEYGTNSLEFPKDVLTAEDNVLIVDDLLAVGGTMNAMIELIQNHTEATVHSGITLINLVDLPKPEFNVPVISLLHLKEK